MKTLLVWAGIFVLCYGGLSAGSHITRSTNAKKILIAVDVSGSMNNVKHSLPDVLSFLNETPYVQYKIVTNSPNKRLQDLQEWNSFLDLNKITSINMYAPISLDKLAEAAAGSDADEIIFITNADDTSALQGVARSRIIKP